MIWLYLADVLETFKVLSIVIVFFLMIALFISIFIYAEACAEEDKKIALKFIKRITVGFVTLLLITVAIPSKTTMYTMLAIKYGERFVSRLKEMCIPMVVEGNDKRTEIAKQRAAEFKNRPTKTQEASA